MYSEYNRLLQVSPSASIIQSFSCFASSQKQFTFDYALAICGSTSDQALYRLQTLLQYQRDKLGYVDLELVAYLERTCVEHQPINASHVYTLYEIYKMIKLPLKSEKKSSLTLRIRANQGLFMFFV